MDRKRIYIIVFIVTTIIASCFAIYFKIDSNKKINDLENKLQDAKNQIEQIQAKQNEEETNNNTSDTNEVVYVRPKIDENKCINKAENTVYTVRRNVNFNDAIRCYIEDDNTVKFEVNYESISKMYGVNITNSKNQRTVKIDNFDKNVVDVYIGSFGHALGDDVLFFLLEDGTVEYMPIAHALQNDTIKSYGKLNGVSDVVEFVTDGARLKEGSGWVTTYAIRKDGSFYDLNAILDLEENNYDIKYE